MILPSPSPGFLTAAEAEAPAFVYALGRIEPRFPNAAVAAACDVLVLAVKPQVVPAVLAELRPVIEPRHLVISIAAGVTMP